MRRAFTLIEMLVVITIIALLIAMLLPAIKRAKRQAKYTLCATQQKQIMTALQTYSFDFNDYWAPGTWGTPTRFRGLKGGRSSPCNPHSGTALIP